MQPPGLQEALLRPQPEERQLIPSADSSLA